MVLSAPGRAYLAFCPEQERRTILNQLLKAKDPGFLQVRVEQALARVIEETRFRGYGTRDPRWGGHFSEPKARYNDGLRAIAVPILNGGRALGCINLVWIAKLFKPAQIVKRHLADLMEAATLIALRYEASQKATRPARSTRSLPQGQERQPSAARSR